MVRTTDDFAPNVSIGELLMLSRLSVLFYKDHVANPGLHLQSELEVSATKIRNALIRIHDAVGPVELTGTHRRTQQPSPRGASVGMAGELAKLIVDISADPSVDQSRLQLELQRTLVALKQRHAEGKYRTFGA